MFALALGVAALFVVLSALLRQRCRAPRIPPVLFLCDAADVVAHNRARLERQVRSSWSSGAPHEIARVVEHFLSRAAVASLLLRNDIDSETFEDAQCTIYCCASPERLTAIQQEFQARQCMRLQFPAFDAIEHVMKRKL